MTRTPTALLAILVSCTLPTVGHAAPKPLRVVGTITAENGQLHDAFAFDETGNKFAYLLITAQGDVEMRIGPPGGKTIRANIADFSAAPERILGLDGHWLVVSMEGRRRGAIVNGHGKIVKTTLSFDDCELSYSPKAFVLVSESTRAGSRVWSIAALKPDGTDLFSQEVQVGGSNTLAGANGATFLGFTNSHFSIMVQKPGAYHAKTDVRSPAQFAIYDVKTGKTGPGKLPPKMDNFLDYVRKRAEKPDQPAVLVLATGQKGFELVGPAEKVRPIQLGALVADYDPLSLAQHYVGNKIVFSLIADRPGRKQDDMNESSRFALGFFSLDPVTAKVTPLGEIPLAQHQSLPWAVGGGKIAVQMTTPEGNREILIYAR